MCRFCERPCFRDGGERDCELSDAEFDEAMNGPSWAELYGDDDDEDFFGPGDPDEDMSLEEALERDAEKIRQLGGDAGRGPSSDHKNDG